MDSVSRKRKWWRVMIHLLSLFQQPFTSTHFRVTGLKRGFGMSHCVGVKIVHLAFANSTPNFIMSLYKYTSSLIPAAYESSNMVTTGYHFSDNIGRDMI